MSTNNLVYKTENRHMDNLKEMISLGGLMKRVNNYYSNIDKNITSTELNLQKTTKDLQDLSKITGENTPKYKKFDYLEALRKDNIEIISEIKKISTDKNYVSEWKPSSEFVKNIKSNIINNIEKSKEIDEKPKISNSYKPFKLKEKSKTSYDLER